MPATKGPVYDVLGEHFIEMSNEKYRLALQHVRSKNVEYISFNRQWLDDHHDWQFGKGFWLPIEDVVDVITALANLVGLEVTFHRE